MRGKAESKKTDAEAYQEADYRHRHPKELQDVKVASSDQFEIRSYQLTKMRYILQRKSPFWNKEGRPLFEIMSLLGHSSLETTLKPGR